MLPGGHTEFGDHAGQLLAVSGDVASFPDLVDMDPSLKLDVTARTEFAWSHPVSPAHILKSNYAAPLCGFTVGR
jgi:hypothetical protein